MLKQMVKQNKIPLITQKLARQLLPDRPTEGHKYSFGQVLVIGGSYRLPGSVAMTCEAVLATGAGAVTLAAPESVMNSGVVLAEVMRLPLSESASGTLDASSWRELAKEDLSKFSAVAMGPGMGWEPDSQEFLAVALPVLLKLKKPLVLDADALNCLSLRLVALNDSVVITPHIGEAQRLIGTDEHLSTAEMIKELRDEYGATVVLKSAHTLVAGDDNQIWKNTTGNSALATAGTGDVLTGIIAALLAQGCTPLAAAQLGVYLHGKAGELAGAEYTQYGVRAGLLSAFLAPGLKTLAQ